MSLITDALQKAQFRPLAEPAPPAPAGGRGPWWSAAAVLGALALLWIWAANGPMPRHRASTAPPARAPAAESLPPIMSLMPGAPSSPSLTWRVDGIITGMGEPLAIINGKTVAQGERLAGGTKVVSVTHEQVELEGDQGQRVTLPVRTER